MCVTDGHADERKDIQNYRVSFIKKCNIDRKKKMPLSFINFKKRL